jgi:hypothetical protein
MPALAFAQVQALIGDEFAKWKDRVRCSASCWWARVPRATQPEQLEPLANLALVRR